MKFGMLMDGNDIKAFIKLVDERLGSIAAQSRAAGKVVEHYPGEQVRLNGMRQRLLMVAQDMQNRPSEVHEV